MKKTPARANATARPKSVKTTTTKTMTVKSAAKKSASTVSRATQKVQPVVKSKAAAKSPGVGSTPKGAAAPKKVARATTSSASKSSVASKKATKSQAINSKVTTSASAKAAAASAKTASGKTVRATKKRAPKDLAAQYGEMEKAPRKTVAKKAPRKRRDAAARARLQEVIAPDDALLLRLARAGAISSSLVPEGACVKPLRVVKTRRARQWEAHCGKCGKSAFYHASAALCVGCGAILVRE